MRISIANSIFRHSTRTDRTKRRSKCSNAGG